MRKLRRNEQKHESGTRWESGEREVEREKHAMRKTDRKTEERKGGQAWRTAWKAAQSNDEAHASKDGKKSNGQLLVLKRMG